MIATKSETDVVADQPSTCLAFVDHPPAVPFLPGARIAVPDDVLAIVQANLSKGKLAPVADGVGFPGGHDVVAGLGCCSIRCIACT